VSQPERARECYKNNVASVLEGFHPALRTWFERRFAAPSRVQELGWPVIRESEGGSGHDVLLCAPTGSGKTLAAFLWAINRLVSEAERGELRDEVSVLYVSPLKALANDIRVNLDEPLDGIRRVAAECGLELAELRAGLRTGDTSAGERGAMLRRPPHILVTTPESLFILLTSPRFREKLRAVRYVVVDELHALAGNKRGAHLVVTLERLEGMVRREGAPRPTRIGLSATLNPVERLAAFLAGAEIGGDGVRRPRPIHTVRADDGARAMDVHVLAPGPDLGPIATHQHWEAMYDALAKLIGEHRTTLVFTLSRRWAERIALNLQKRLGAEAVMAHHGSLARAERLMAEQRLKRGELSAIVATASLELGIDVGTVDLVCQVDSPKSISAAIQRIGRSGHSLTATPKGRFFALTLDDLMECAAVVRAIRRGRLDEVEIPTGCLDVAAQQIVAIAAEEGEIGEAELLRILRRADNFANLDLAALRRLLDEMVAEQRARIRGVGPKIFHDRIGGRVRARRAARLVAITSGGTIPESGNYDVVIQSEGRKIGDVEEDFAQESSRGDIFALGSTPWRILGISRSRLMVEPAPGMSPTLPFWQTEASGRSLALSAELCALRRELAAQLAKASGGADGAAALLREECALDESAATQALAYTQRGLAALGALPDERTLVVERFFDGLGGTQIVIHVPLGIRLNRGFGLALRKRLCQVFDFEIQASALDDGVLLALNARHSFALERVLVMLNSRNVGAALVQALLDAPMFEVRFRHVATRALEVMRSAQGRRVPAWLQRLRAQELMGAIFPARQACFENRSGAIELPDHFLVQETMRECTEEATDLPRLVRLLEDLERGSVRARTVDAVAPSVMAQRILLAWDYSFLDGGERANRRSRTVAMNRAMAEDVLREEDLSSMLSAEAVASVAAEVSGRALARRARDSDELCELIRAHGAIEETGLAELTKGDARAMASKLEREGRALRARLVSEGPQMLLTFEDASMFGAAYPEISFVAESGTGETAQFARSRFAEDGRAADDAIEPDAAREEIVRRAVATSGPTSVPEIARRLSMPAAAVQRALLALEAKGDVFRGHFTPSSGRANDGEQWCDRYNLEKIHRLTLGRIRAEVEPCTDREFAAFRLAWQHVGGAGLSSDPGGVALVLEQLSGLLFTPDFWEQSILPARVQGYRSEYLDMLCISGEMGWVAMRDGDDVAEMPLRVAFFKRKRPRIWAHARPALTDSKERAVYEALLAGGAQYLDQAAERAGLSERDTVRALWHLSAAGWASNDSFAPLRMLCSKPDAVRAFASSSSARGLSRHDAALRARLKSSMSGRWTAVDDRRKPPVNAHASGFDGAREVATLLLERNGVLAREMLAAEPETVPWPELSFTLRRMEYAGTIRRGYFVRTLSGEQYALPAAAEMLRAMRGLDPAGERPVALGAADPANPYGFLLPACCVSRESANVVVLRGGEVILGLAGRALMLPEPLDNEAFCAAVAALIAYRPKLAVEKIDGCRALESSRVPALAAMGFHSDGRALQYDGLLGPLPAGARSLGFARKASGPARRRGER
jgi:ATP-dependent helicase Lhr and Lhr-like helicase